uniref:Uncharacterized protein n=1 Tax=Arundo donax TaxID=35708 RepID=A0A0A9BI95_ARUDO
MLDEIQSVFLNLKRMACSFSCTSRNINASRMKAQPSKFGA